MSQHRRLNYFWSDFVGIYMTWAHINTTIQVTRQIFRKTGKITIILLAFIVVKNMQSTKLAKLAASLFR